MRRAIGALAALAVIVVLPTASAEQTEPTMARARVAKVVKNPKPHVTLVRRFTPPASPSPGYVRTVIIPAEARRWGVGLWRLSNRIACESRFRYWAHNQSGASGLGQFMPSTWSRALRSWSRGVRLRSVRTRLVRRRVTLLYDDGSRNVVRGRLVRRRVTVVQRGLLPRWPGIYHGWASVRGAARALAGRGQVGAGEWSCF
jgi:hypothetical protein